MEIANGEAERLIRGVHEREGPSETCVIGLDWSFALEDLLEIVQVSYPWKPSRFCGYKTED